MRPLLVAASAALLVLFPIAWFAPLMTVKLRFRFWADGTEFTVVTLLQRLWAEDSRLALLVTFFAIVAPTVKVLGLMLVQMRLASARVEPALFLIGRLAMADVFLVALAVAILRGVEGGTVTVHWGLWLFTACILGSLALSLVTPRRPRR